MEAIALAGGRRVELVEPTRGGSKNDTRYGRLEGERVVAKIQGAYGRLADEERALRFLVAHGVPVPRVIESGLTTEGHRFLVISREPGAPPVTPEGWASFGRDLAALATVPVARCPFPRICTEAFVADHRERLALVQPLLDSGLAREISGAIAQIAGSDRLVVTHGDPGSGNYLENPAGAGTLLDWETTSVSPFGLDLGRGAFIGLLDLWGTGAPDGLLAAFLRGYTGRSPLAAELTGEVLRAWITIGGLQFIHGRQTEPLLPERTPQVATGVLERYLTTAVSVLTHAGLRRRIRDSRW